MGGDLPDQNGRWQVCPARMGLYRLAGLAVTNRYVGHPCMMTSALLGELRDQPAARAEYFAMTGIART
jgi:hypothetical protein